MNMWAFFLFLATPPPPFLPSVQEVLSSMLPSVKGFWTANIFSQRTNGTSSPHKDKEKGEIMGSRPIRCVCNYQ